MIFAARHVLALGSFISAVICILFQDWYQFGIEILTAVIITPFWDKE